MSVSFRNKIFYLISIFVCCRGNIDALNFSQNVLLKTSHSATVILVSISSVHLITFLENVCIGQGFGQILLPHLPICKKYMSDFTSDRLIKNQGNFSWSVRGCHKMVMWIGYHGLGQVGLS